MNQKITFDIGDITRLDVDAIVNAANKTLLGGGGVDGAIHRAAGHLLLEECKKLNGCQTGEAKITKGYNLNAHYVIHTVGPIYSGVASDAVDLANCYQNSLDIARENNICSIAFPAISTGVYGYPKQDAARIAIDTIQKWFNDNPNYEIKVIMSCFNQEMYDIYMEVLR
ncbi:MAG: O-acetyl-ADP-ribose deacetylase [Neisseriaceae bacterium]|nr:O-acetyl-ADP-ribose deacetylase [Neisseriaceae bacterium]